MRWRSKSCFLFGKVDETSIASVGNQTREAPCSGCWMYINYYIYTGTCSPPSELDTVILGRNWPVLHCLRRRKDPGSLIERDLPKSRSFSGRFCAHAASRLIAPQLFHPLPFNSQCVRDPGKWKGDGELLTVYFLFSPKLGCKFASN